MFADGGAPHTIDSAYLDVLLVEGEAGFLVDEEVSDLDTVVALQLDHLAHTLGLGVTDDGAIAGCETVSACLTLQAPSACQHTELLLNDLENLLVIELRRNALHRGQGLTSITLCGTVSFRLFGAVSTLQREAVTRQWSIERRTLDADMDVLLGLSSLSRVLVGFGEGV